MIDGYDPIKACHDAIERKRQRDAEKDAQRARKAARRLATQEQARQRRLSRKPKKKAMTYEEHLAAQKQRCLERQQRRAAFREHMRTLMRKKKEQCESFTKYPTR